MMDADQLTEQAQIYIKREDFSQAKACLKEAAALAPLRADIRDQLVQTMLLEEAYVAEIAETNQKKQRGRRRRLSSGRLAIGAIGIVVCFGLAIAAFFLLKDYFFSPPEESTRDILQNNPKPTPTPALDSPRPTPTATPDARALEMERARKTFDSSLAAGRRSEAKEALGKLLDLNAPDAVELRKSLAQAYFKSGEERYEQGSASSGAAQEPHLNTAKKTLLEALELDPDLLKAYDTLAKTCNKLRDRNGAAKYFKEIIKRAPGSPDAKAARKALDDLKIPVD